MVTYLFERQTGSTWLPDWTVFIWHTGEPEFREPLSTAGTSAVNSSALRNAPFACGQNVHAFMTDGSLTSLGHDADKRANFLDGWRVPPNTTMKGEQGNKYRTGRKEDREECYFEKNGRGNFATFSVSLS